VLEAELASDVYRHATLAERRDLSDGVVADG
jgi:hypothetical protein